MKKILLSAVLVLAAATCHATIINVSNAPTAPVNPPYTYNSLQTAVNAAADGDSLYVHGTNISYGTLTITNKTLVLIGAGYGNNLMSNFNQKTIISDIVFAGFTGVKNVVLVGIYISNNLTTSTGNAPVNNLMIDRCGLYRIQCQCNNLIFHQSLLEVSCDGNPGFQPVVNSNAVIQNSVLGGNITGGSVNNALWEHNIFKQVDCAIGNITSFNGNAVFRDNIFNNNFSIGVSNCTFNNNLFVSIGSLGSGNSGTGNIFSTPAGFVNNAAPNNTIGRENYATAVDYHLAAGSAAIGTGTGGANMGIYGGTDALPATAVLNGVPAMPRITEMNIQNLSVAPNGNLNVQLKAVKEN